MSYFYILQDINISLLSFNHLQTHIFSVVIVMDSHLIFILIGKNNVLDCYVHKYRYELKCLAYIKK